MNKNCTKSSHEAKFGELKISSVGYPINKTLLCRNYTWLQENQVLLRIYEVFVIIKILSEPSGFVKVVITTTRYTSPNVTFLTLW
jgi:hypothetical protein